MKYVTSINGHDYEIEIIDESHITVDGKPYKVDFISVSGQPVYSLLINGESFEAHIHPEEDIWQVLFHGELYPVRVEDERERRLRTALAGKAAQAGEFHLKAPMPGMVVAVPVEEGQTVKKGETLVILESMKMQNELHAPRDGKILRVRVAAGDRVEQKQTLLSVG
jgi:biotin carboxyl carrier protein